MRQILLYFVPALLSAQITPATVQADINSAQAALVQALTDLANLPPPVVCPPPQTGGAINWFPIAAPNFATGWTWENQSTAAVSVSSLGFDVFAIPYQSAAQFNSLVQSLPAPPYTVTITFAMTTPLPGSYTTGLTLTNASNSQAVDLMVNMYYVTGALVVTHETLAPGSITTEITPYQNNNAPDGQIRSLRVHDDGATRTFSYSGDGGTAFVPIYSEPSGTFMQPDHWGVVLFNRANPGITVYSTIYFMGVTTP